MKMTVKELNDMIDSIDYSIEIEKAILRSSHLFNGNEKIKKLVKLKQKLESQRDVSIIELNTDWLQLDEIRILIDEKGR